MCAGKAWRHNKNNIRNSISNNSYDKDNNSNNKNSSNNSTKIKINKNNKNNKNIVTRSGQVRSNLAPKVHWQRKKEMSGKNQKYDRVQIDTELKF